MDRIGGIIVLILKYLPTIAAVASAILGVLYPEAAAQAVADHPIATGAVVTGGVVLAQLTKSPIEKVELGNGIKITPAPPQA